MTTILPPYAVRDRIQKIGGKKVRHLIPLSLACIISVNAPNVALADDLIGETANRTDASLQDCSANWQGVGPKAQTDGTQCLAPSRTRALAQDTSASAASAPTGSDPSAASSAGQGSASASSGGGGISAAEFAKAANNPIDTRFMQIPLQPNINFKQGPRGYRSTGVNTKLQPLVPIFLSDKITMLVRPVMPINYVPRSGPDHYQRKIFGPGDFYPQIYFLPAKPWDIGGGWKFATSLGPGFQVPNKKGRLGNHRWTLGGNGAVVFSKGGFTAAAVYTQVWSIDSKSRDSKWKKVSAMTVQPIISYTFPSGFYFTTSPFMTVDWKAHNRKVTLPVGGGAGKSFKIFGVNWTGEVTAYRNVTRQRYDAKWQLRFQLTALLRNPFNKAH